MRPVDEKWDDMMLPPMIILAAGKSERFGSPKGLAPHGDETMLAAHIRSYLKYGSLVVVVVGHIVEPYIKELNFVCSTYPFERRIDIAHVENFQPELGPFSSLQAGISFLGQQATSGIFVQPVDTGVVPATLYQELYAESTGGLNSVVPEYLGKGGHPVFLGRGLCQSIPSIDPSSPRGRLDVLLHAEPRESVRRFPVDDSEIIININTRVIQ